MLSLESSSTGEILYSAEDAQMWLLDSGATFHMTPYLKWFMDYSSSFGWVQIGNAEELQLSGFGTIPLRLPNWNEITIQQVSHIPELKQSLISISMLVDHGYRTTLNESIWRISKGNMHIDHGVKYKTLYPHTVVGH